MTEASARYCEMSGHSLTSGTEVHHRPSQSTSAKSATCSMQLCISDRKKSARWTQQLPNEDVDKKKSDRTSTSTIRQLQSTIKALSRSLAWDPSSKINTARIGFPDVRRTTERKAEICALGRGDTRLNQTMRHHHYHVSTAIPALKTNASLHPDHRDGMFQRHIPSPSNSPNPAGSPFLSFQGILALLATPTLLSFGSHGTSHEFGLHLTCHGQYPPTVCHKSMHNERRYFVTRIGNYLCTVFSCMKCIIVAAARLSEHVFPGSTYHTAGRTETPPPGGKAKYPC